MIAPSPLFIISKIYLQSLPQFPGRIPVMSTIYYYERMPIENLQSAFPSYLFHSLKDAL